MRGEASCLTEVHSVVHLQSRRYHVGLRSASGPATSPPVCTLRSPGLFTEFRLQIQPCYLLQCVALFRNRPTVFGLSASSSNFVVIMSQSFRATLVTDTGEHNGTGICRRAAVATLDLSRATGAAGATHVRLAAAEATGRSVSPGASRVTGPARSLRSAGGAGRSC